MQILDKVKELISNLLQDNGIELVDSSYRRGKGTMLLKLLVDKVGGVTLDDCSRLNEDIGKVLDEANAMPDKYVLEVSSPGLDRPLKTKRDFERVMGKKIYVHTYEPIQDKRDYVGSVSGVDEESVTVDNVKIPLNKISKARLEIKI